MTAMSEQKFDARDSSSEPLEVKLIIAASDGHVNVTPEKCERIRKLLYAAGQAAAGQLKLTDVMPLLGAYDRTSLAVGGITAAGELVDALNVLLRSKPASSEGATSAAKDGEVT